MNSREKFIQKKLYGFDKHLSNFIKLSEKKRLPQILMLSGKKGQGKFTFVHHFLAIFFDKKNYDISLKIIKDNNKIAINLKENLNPDILYFSCENNIGIEEIRNLRSNLQKTSLNNNIRYVIFDDIEYLNNNCVNALLKTIEEPSDTNYFILINNQNKILLDTLRSRSIEIKIFINKKERINIIKNLISENNEPIQQKS